MKINDYAVDHRATVYVLLVLFLVFGSFCYWVLPRESNPEIVVPILIVTTVYEGVTPADIEALVTIPIERKLTGLSDVKSMESDSAEGISVIKIEFEADTDIDMALQKVRDKVDQAKPDIPEAADDPSITEVNISDLPVMFLSLTGTAGLPLLTNVAEDLEDAIESIKGVLDVKVVGGVEREIQIIVDPDRATEYGISMADLVTLARVENVNTPAGSVELGEAKFSVRVPGEFQSAEEINGLIVKAGPEGIVYMRDIAEVRDGFKDTETLSRLNGRDAVTLTISKRAGENVIKVAEKVHAVVEQYKTRLLPGMELQFTMDESNDIRDMVSELNNSILSGLILVLGVIFLFIGLANAVMVSLAIPVSMLITFIALYMTDTTLNMVVLFSLILALGMLVDNGIVVVENIYRHVTQNGLSPARAAKQGADEVAWPIIGSSLTTVVAFLPMFFWPGIWGSFMFFLPQTVTLALVASLFVGMVVNPALASVFIRPTAKKVTKEIHKRHRIIRVYAGVLRLALRWRLVTIVLAVTCLMVISTVYLRGAEIEFIPNTEPRSAYIDVDLPEGAKLEETDKIIRQIETLAAQYGSDVEFIISSVGSRGVNIFSSIGGGGSSSHIGRVTLDFPPFGEWKVPPTQIIQDVRGHLKDITGAKVHIIIEEHGPSTKPPVNVEISGDDFAMLEELAQRVKDVIKDTPNLVDVADNYEKGKPEIKVNVDRQQALLLGLNTEFIGQAVRAAINGRKAGDYREGDEEYDVTVRFPKSFRENLNNLESLCLVNLGGKAVPFSSVARLEQGAGLGTVTRVERKRTVTVSGEVQGRPGAEVLQDVREKMAGFPLPNGYSIAYTGQNEEQEESQGFLMRAFAVALFLIALVLVAQFDSVIQPLIIMSSVILSLTGVFLGLRIHGMPFDVIMSGIGCISLAGVVVNNAIVLLDFINERRKQGASVEEAVVDAGVTRFRPVMLTAITTVLGLVPMAAGISYDFFNLKWVTASESSQWWGPMAIVVIYGLGFATLLTLIVVPVLYSFTESIHRFFFGERQPEH